MCPFFFFLTCTAWSKFNCAFVSSRGFKASFPADFVGHLFACVDMSRNILEGTDRFPWEQFALYSSRQELGFSHLRFDTFPFRLRRANRSLSLLSFLRS